MSCFPQEAEVSRCPRVIVTNQAFHTASSEPWSSTPGLQALAIMVTSGLFSPRRKPICHEIYKLYILYDINDLIQINLADPPPHDQISKYIVSCYFFTLLLPSFFICLCE